MFVSTVCKYIQKTYLISRANDRFTFFSRPTQQSVSRRVTVGESGPHMINDSLAYVYCYPFAHVPG